MTLSFVLAPAKFNRKQYKPRIYRKFGFWWCRYKNFDHQGSSPLDAYNKLTAYIEQSGRFENVSR